MEAEKGHGQVSGKVFTEAEIAASLADGAKETADWLSSYAAGTEAAAAEAEQKAEASLFGFEGPDRNRIVNSAKEEARAKIYAAATSTSTFKDKSQKLGAMREQLGRRLESVKDPLAILERFTIADPQRATYSKNLESAGGATLQNLAGKAVEERNPGLGMAVCIELQKLSANKRQHMGLDTRAIAEQCLPEPALQTRKHLAAARETLDVGLLHFQRVLSPHRTSARSLSKIASGLDKMAADREAARKNPLEPLNRILRGEVQS